MSVVMQASAREDRAMTDEHISYDEREELNVIDLAGNGDAGRARPTMQDVAAAARVSLKTVSRVVNNEPNVGLETRERVNKVIAELGFRRNDLARNLRQG